MILPKDLTDILHVKLQQEKPTSEIYRKIGGKMPKTFIQKPLSALNLVCVVIFAFLTNYKSLTRERFHILNSNNTLIFSINTWDLYSIYAV